MFLKILSIKFHENPSSRSRVVPCVQTDGHDEASSRHKKECKVVGTCSAHCREIPTEMECFKIRDGQGEYASADYLLY